MLWSGGATAIRPRPPPRPPPATAHPERRPGPAPPQAIGRTGGPGAGPAGIARRLRAPAAPWIRRRGDGLRAALPPALADSGPGVAVGPRGAATVGAGGRALAAAWLAGVAAVARAGARGSAADAFLGGAAPQVRARARPAGRDLRRAAHPHPPHRAAGRAVARGDRLGGLAAAQAEAVPLGVADDLAVGTGTAEASEGARAIAARLA